MFKRTDWFILLPVDKIKEKEGVILKKEIVSKIKKFFFFKFKKVNYYEVYTNKQGTTFVIFGSSKLKKNSKGYVRYNRNVVVFLLELYADMEETNKITDSFPCKVKKIKEKELSIYKVKNY